MNLDTALWEREVLQEHLATAKQAERDAEAALQEARGLVLRAESKRDARRLVVKTFEDALEKLGLA